MPKARQISFNLPPDILARMKSGRQTWFVLEFEPNAGGYRYKRPYRFRALITKLEVATTEDGDRLRAKITIATGTNGVWDVIFTSNEGDDELVCTNERLMEAMTPIRESLEEAPPP